MKVKKTYLFKKQFLEKATYKNERIFRVKWMLLLHFYSSISSVLLNKFFFHSFIHKFPFLGLTTHVKKWGKKKDSWQCLCGRLAFIHKIVRNSLKSRAEAVRFLSVTPVKEFRPYDCILMSCVSVKSWLSFKMSVSTQPRQICQINNSFNWISFYPRSLSICCFCHIFYIKVNMVLF